MGAIKGLYRLVAGGGALDFSGSQVTDTGNSLGNFKTAAQGGGNVQIVAGSTAAGGGTISAPTSVAAGALTTNLRVPGVSGNAANLKGSGTTESPVAITESLTLYQMHDFDDDSVGHKTGGITNAFSNAASELSVTATKYDPVLADYPGPTLASGLSSDFAAGDKVYIECNNPTGWSTTSGYYKIVYYKTVGGTNDDIIVLDRPLQTDAVESGQNSAVDATCLFTKVVDSPCEVEETVKGTSENAECSNRGLCDSQTGLCTCFSGYTGEDCSVQTVMV